VIGGGARVEGANARASGRVMLTSSVPFQSTDVAGWSATAAEVHAQAETTPDVTPVDEPDDFSWGLSVYAICAKSGS
jgi:hypothetical protein